MSILVSVFAIIVLCMPQSAFAREFGDTGYAAIYMPELLSTSVVIDNDSIEPAEPNMGEVEFQKRSPFTSIDERVDRLIHGIQKDIPPEFDHYGYEIRRYMSRIGNLEIFSNEEYLKDQIINIRKARVISEYWSKELEQEVLDIEEIIDGDQLISSQVRTAFRQNKITVRTFLISLKGWIDSNEKLLFHIFNHSDIFEVYYPEIIIGSPQENLTFYNNSLVKQTKLKEIVVYRSFAMMVY